MEDQKVKKNKPQSKSEENETEEEGVTPKEAVSDHAKDEVENEPDYICLGKCSTRSCGCKYRDLPCSTFCHPGNDKCSRKPTRD